MTSLTLSVDSTVRLTVAISPANAANKAVRWESGDPAIASVTADGVVTDRAAGTTDITVTTMDGNKTAACLVTVISTHTGIPSPRQAQQPAARVYLDRQILHVDSPAVETLLYRLDKPARETSLTVNRSKGILIVRGSSGWSGKPVM